MSPESIIDDAKERAGEYLEMTTNPDAIVSGILAFRIVQLNEHIIFLERRLEKCKQQNTPVWSRDLSNG